METDEPRQGDIVLPPPPPRPCFLILQVFSRWVLSMSVVALLGFFFSSLFHNYMHWCACIACSICQSRVWDGVHTGVRLLVFVCIMLWPRQELKPQRKSTANNSTATGTEPYHPRGLWDRVYNQRQSVGGQKSVRVTLCYILYSVQFCCLCLHGIPCFSLFFFFCNN